MVSKESDTSLKIVYVVGSLESGGIERSVTEWALYLKQNTQWQPVVICVLKRKGNFLEVLASHGIEVYECKLKNESASPFTFRMAKLLRELRPRVVHSQVAFSLLWQTMAYVIGGARKIIFTQQNEYKNWNNFSAKLRLRFYYHFSKFFIDYYTCVSSRVRTNLSSLLNVSPHHFRVIYNSVNTDIFYPQPQYRDGVRKKMNLKDNDFAIGMVASFSEQKGHKYILEACALLKKEFDSFKLILIGSGDSSAQQRMVEKLNIADKVVLLGNRNDVDELLQGFNCFALPSLWEGLPLALLEAMACEIPVLGSDTSGISEVIDHGSTGILFTPGDPTAIKAAILTLKKDSERAAKLATAGKNFVKEKFGLPVSMNQYIQLYEN